MSNDETLLPEIEAIVKNLERQVTRPPLSDGEKAAVAALDHIQSATLDDEAVPEQIAKTAQGIENYGRQWAEQQRASADQQLEADKKRHQDAHKFADTVEQRALDVARHVKEWALTTREANLMQRQAFAKLNGGGANASKAEKGYGTQS
jgi:hypothetical protein